MATNFANPYDALTADAENGALYREGRRAIVTDADAVGVLRRQLIEQFGLQQARKLLSQFGYAGGYRGGLTARQQAAMQKDATGAAEDYSRLWTDGMQAFARDGKAGVRPLRLEIDAARGVFEAELEWFNSYEAEQHLTHFGASSVPVCWTLTGYAGGLASALVGREVFFLERKCVGRGDARCVAYGSAEMELGSESARLARSYNLLNDEDFAAKIERITGERAELQRLVKDLETRAVELARERARIDELETQVVYLQESLNETYNVRELVGTSPAFKHVMRDVTQVAATDATVLLTGETGTGKELIARAIHARSSRQKRPLVTVNCAALPAGLIESELFGHEKGAFTGASARRLGRFEIANGATLFLDEVGELPLDVQAKFLRVLQEGEFERVGGAFTLKTDARVIAATNQPLEKLVAEGKFRADLFYRLNVFPLHLPPLRERREDIRLLTNYFAQKYRARFKKPIASIEQRSLERLLDYPFPGNVRELEHIVERAVLLAAGEILVIHPPSTETDGNHHAAATINADGNFAARNNLSSPLVSLAEMERGYIQEVLKRAGGAIAGKGGAAEILDLPASTLRSRMKKLGIK